MYACYGKCTCILLIWSTWILLLGPVPNAFTACTKTVTSLSTAGKLIVKNVSSVGVDPFIMFSP